MNGYNMAEMAQRMNDIADGLIWYCPKCGEEHRARDYPSVVCPHCKRGDCQEITFEAEFDNALDAEITASPYSPDTVKSGGVLITYGGPNIWVTTSPAEVHLYWGLSEESSPISEDAKDGILDYLQEVWDARRD